MSSDPIFDACFAVNEHLNEGRDEDARNEVIVLLDRCYNSDLKYTPLLNHLIRQVGLYPYIKPRYANWEERFIFEAFKVDIGKDRPITLHKEQSLLLKRLIEGKDLAISAPTSFGKSFVIDAYICLRKPKNVAIIVPTIALTDETRRRLYPKFSRDYKIITTSNVELGSQNIFIFPQERAIDYADKIEELDILIIDEFYKASHEFDRERSNSLQRAMLKLGPLAKQRYFLAPNITKLSANIFTGDVEFWHIKFNTVILEKHESFLEIKGNEQKKSEVLVRILKKEKGKTLIYAGTYPDIDRVTLVLLDEYKEYINYDLRTGFAKWLSENYDPDWDLVKLVKRGIGIHNGQLHRSLGQIQIKLFEEKHGLDRIISTSSIIEGVNTSAENVVLWRNKNGKYKLNDFTYKNIIGRGGRMFKHFVGKVFLLEQPPDSKDIPLSIDLQDEILCEVEETDYSSSLSRDQIVKIIKQKGEMENLLGREFYEGLRKGGILQMSDWLLVRSIALELIQNPTKWKRLGYLHSHDPDQWAQSIFAILGLKPGWWDVTYSKFVEFVKILAGNWKESTPQLLAKLKPHSLGISDFFKLERNVTYKLASLLHDVNVLQKHLLPQNHTDVGPFVAKAANAFMPQLVFQLEEYGLPRNICKKLELAKWFDFSGGDMNIHQAIAYFNLVGMDNLFGSVTTLDQFDQYIINHFFEGISTTPVSIDLK